jgi:HlyD family secretion protein
VITHETGGVLAGLFVAEGDRVEKGQVLAEIEDTDRAANLKQLQSRLAYFSILEKRLLAEKEDKQFSLPDKAFSSFPFKRFYADQVSVFEARQGVQRKEKTLLRQKMQSLKRELHGKKRELKALAMQRNILHNQVEMRSVLLSKGSISKMSMQNTQKAYAEIDRSYYALKTQIDLIPHQILTIQEQIKHLTQEFKVTIMQELAQLRGEKVVLEQKLEVARKVAERVMLRAPVSGAINKVHVNSISSAVPAFHPMIEIVPETKQTLFEVEVRPTDIEQLRIGQSARLVLNGYDEEKISPILAKVRYISTDRQMHPTTRQSYFIARLELANEKLNEMPEISPGMPVMSYIQHQPAHLLK